jgi:hypothetical protein
MKTSFAEQKIVCSGRVAKTIKLEKIHEESVTYVVKPIQALLDLETICSKSSGVRGCCIEMKQLKHLHQAMELSLSKRL